MRGAIPPLPNTPSWRGDQFKNTFTFTFKREEVAGGCCRLYNEELHNFYTSTTIID
jgi:hypothetical protein